ncbi:hypothetical protein Hanom_Chr16g01481501 [Helianthus anomalus]
MYHFFDKFHNRLPVLDNCTFIYTTIRNTIFFTLQILEMYMCIYMYEYDITCFWYTTLNIIHNTLSLPPNIHNTLPLPPTIHNTLPLPVCIKFFTLCACTSTSFIQYQTYCIIK